MPYNLDLSVISVQEYKELLKKQNLLPGRVMLRCDLESNFSIIERQGISTVAQLKGQLSSKGKLTLFAAATGISERYLTVLKREIGSLEQKPLMFSSFPEIDAAVIADLNSRGIKTTKDYIDASAPCTDELFCLCDLTRINGVGAVAARAFYEAGYRSAKDVAQGNAAEMLKGISAVNDTQHYYRAKLGIKDMQFCIDYASLLVRYEAKT